MSRILLNTLALNCLQNRDHYQSCLMTHRNTVGEEKKASAELFVKHNIKMVTYSLNRTFVILQEVNKHQEAAVRLSDVASLTWTSSKAISKVVLSHFN